MQERTDQASSEGSPRAESAEPLQPAADRPSLLQRALLRLLPSRRRAQEFLARVEQIEAYLSRLTKDLTTELTTLEARGVQRTIDLKKELQDSLAAIQDSHAAIQDSHASAVDETRTGIQESHARIEQIEHHLPEMAQDLSAELTALETRGQTETDDLKKELQGSVAAIHDSLAAVQDSLAATVGETQIGIQEGYTRIEQIERHLLEMAQDVNTDLADARATQESQGRHLDEVAAELVANALAVAKLDKQLTRFSNATQSEQEQSRLRIRTLEQRFEPLTDLDHFDFANVYRGNASVIRDRLKKYAIAFGEVDGLLDFGCGRGEFLEVCSELGVGAYGYDTDDDMISHCKLKNLEVFQGDALAHLRQLPSRSLGGIFSAQVVEHLTPIEIVEMTQLAADKLRRGGKIIMETINPGTWSAMRWFYLDPSHSQPVPAEMLQFFLEEANFEVLDILYSSPVPEDERLASLKNDIPSDDPAIIEAFSVLNRNWERLNDTLFGPQDYAIIAER